MVLLINDTTTISLINQDLLLFYFSHDIILYYSWCFFYLYIIFNYKCRKKESRYDNLNNNKKLNLKRDLLINLTNSRKK